MDGAPAVETVEPPDPTPASEPRRRQRVRNVVTRGVAIAAAVTLAWFVARLAQRPELFTVSAVGLGLVALIGAVRGLVRTVTGRWKKVLLLGAVVLLIGAACLSSIWYFSFGRGDYAAAPPPLPSTIVLPLAVSAEYAGDGKVNDGQVVLHEELVVSGATMNRVRDDILDRVLNARDPSELVAAVVWCLEADGSGEPAVVPTTWILPEGISLIDPSVEHIRKLIAANWESQCFRPERLDSSDWDLSLRRDDNYVYRRERVVPFDVGWMYSTPTVDPGIRAFSVTVPAAPLGFRFAAAPPSQTGVTLDAPVTRSGYYEGPYYLEPARDSSIRLTGAAQAIAAVDPATTVVSQPGVGDRVVVDVSEHTDSVNLVVLSAPFRNSPGRAVYQSLQWGPLQWVLGLVTLVVSGFLSDLGLGLFKRIFGRFRRASPTLRPRPPAG